MFDGTTLIVDVETLGENSYALSLPAEDLWVAYEVVRRHVDANGVRHFSQMVEAKTTSDGYSFKFDTGDTFTCVSHLDKPTSSTLSDTSSELPSVSSADEGKVLTVNNSGVWVAQTPASGGGVLVVHEEQSGDDTVLDKNYNEITDAMLNGGAYIVGGDENGGSAFYISSWEIYGGEYSIFLADHTEYKSSSATGVLTKISPK